MERTRNPMGGDAPALDRAIATGDRRAAHRHLVARKGDGAVHTALDHLARAATDGNTLAVELLIKFLDEQAVARRAVQTFLLDRDAVDDVTQDVLISVARSIGSFRQDASFATWLYTIARNRAADHLRRRRPTEPLDATSGAHDHGPAPAERMSSLVASDAVVRQILARLPEPYSEVVRLRDVEHRPYDEMVRTLGRPLNTVRSQVARGRALLAAALDQDGRL